MAPLPPPSWLKPHMWNHLYRRTTYPVGPHIWRDHISGGTTYPVGLCVQRDLVSGGEGPCMGPCI